MATAADHLLLDLARRRARQPVGWLAIVLHLARLAAPAPRPHHRRIARALMEDTAQRHDGQVLCLGNGDLVLLCRAGGSGRPPAATMRVAIPAELPRVLGRLLRIDAPDPRSIVSLWPLETASESLLGYALDRIATGGGGGTVRPPREDWQAEAQGQTGATEEIARLVAGPAIADLLKRQTAVLLSDEAMRPLFREVTFSMAAIEARMAPPLSGPPEADPFLFHHLTGHLDRRMLDSDAILEAASLGAPPLHFNMTLAGLRTPGFAAAASRLHERGVRFGVEIALVDAAADPAAWHDARTAMARLGGRLVLDGVTALALRLARVAAFEPELVKLDWAPRLADPGEDLAPVRRLLADLGPARVVLHRAETEAALHWGLQLGIRRFQGRHVDAMLAASRLSSCAHASHCSLRQCVERAAAASALGRALCRDTGLLDAGMRLAIPAGA